MTRSILIVSFAIFGPFLWFFSPVLLQGRSFGFRDAANYYHPLFEWECREWREGRVPLWNPLDNGGSPVLADTTPSVLYPGKLVFTLPVSYRLRYHVYVTMHVLLAAAVTYALSRRWNGTVESSGLAAMAYAFSGSVLFQYCNVVFLVGAAWLPASLYAGDRMLRERSDLWALLLGAVLALMTLGGDPQAAYHAGLLVFLYGAFIRIGKPELKAAHRRIRWWRTDPILLAIATTSGIGLALVQILPAMERTRQSDRAVFDTPRNLYEVASWTNDGLEQRRDVKPDPCGSPIVKGIFATPAAGTHLRHVYDFSIGPWHLAELFWPNVSGRMFPKNERWVTAMPAEGRTWTPSLYMGLLPILLALGALGITKSDRRRSFLTVMSLIGIVGSFGWYGLGWLLHELQGALPGMQAEREWIGYPVGGLYWLFVVCLPGYVYFRYPAKLMVLAALGISLLAARGWDRIRGETTQLRRRLLAVATISLAAAVLFGALQKPWNGWLEQAPADAIFGPLDTDAATSGVLKALAHAAVGALCLWLLLSKRLALRLRTSSQAVLVLTAIDLCVANGWMMVSIDSSVFERANPIAEAIAAREGNGGGVGARLMRTRPPKLLPTQWSTHSTAKRMEQVVEWERCTLLPKHHLHHAMPLIGTHSTLRQRDWSAWLQFVRSVGEHRSEQTDSSTLLAPLCVEYVAAPEDQVLSGCELLPQGVADGIRLWHNPRAYPRAWIAHSMDVLKPLSSSSHAALQKRTREVFLDDGRMRNLRDKVVLEAAEEALPGALLPPAKVVESACDITRDQPQLVEIEATVAAAGVLVLEDTYDRGWRASRTTNGATHPLTIYRANRLMRAVFLPPGTHRVTFTYRPASFLAGAAVSAVGWLALAIVCLVRVRRRLA